MSMRHTMPLASAPLVTQRIAHPQRATYLEGPLHSSCITTFRGHAPHATALPSARTTAACQASSASTTDSTNKRTVARFVPRRENRWGAGLIDSGRAYIVWLTTERAADVARGHRRRSRHTTVFSLLDTRMMSRLQAYTASRDASSDDVQTQADLCLRLHDAIPHLPPRERLVMELLIEGKNQATIAHVLDVCEGTVSRLRMRAIASLRDLMVE